MTSADHVIFRTGDQLICGDGPSTQWFTRSAGEDRTVASHVGTVLSYEDAQRVRAGSKYRLPQLVPGEPCVIEAQWRVGINPLRERIASGVREIWRPLDLPEGPDGDLCRTRLVKRACQFAGAPYGALKIPFQALDGLVGKLFGPTYFFRRACRLDNPPICSGLNAHLAQAAVLGPYIVSVEDEEEVSEWYFGVDPNGINPDEIHDCMMATPARFRLVWSSKE